MSQRENEDQYVRRRDKVPIWLGYLLIGILVLWLILESAGAVNFVKIEPPITASDFSLIASAVGTIILTFGLLLLYDKQAYIQRIQAQTQRNQEQLMEQQFQPYMTGEVDFMNITSVNFSIQNSGNGPAFDVVAEWSVADQSKSWEIPRLSAGENHSFPIIVDGDDWLLSTSEIEDYLDEHNSETEIEYSIECKDRFGEELEFSGEVDFGVLIQRSNSDEIWDSDPIEEIQSDLGKIQRDMKKITRYQKNRDRSFSWKDRVRQNEKIEALVEKHGELTVEQINSLTNISEPNIRYRLRTLDDIGSINFVKNSDKAKSSRNNQNKDLSDF